MCHSCLKVVHSNHNTRAMLRIFRNTGLFIETHIHLQRSTISSTLNSHSTSKCLRSRLDGKSYSTSASRWSKNVVPSFSECNALYASSKWLQFYKDLSKSRHLTITRCLSLYGNSLSKFDNSDNSPGEDNFDVIPDIDPENPAGQDRSVLDKDPDLKSIIEDIKRDFASEKKKAPSDKNDMSSIDPSKPNKDGIAKADSNQFEFDYAVAEDIEEYDYIDDSQIGQHQVQLEKILPIDLERGQSGVFDLNELLTLLDHLGAEDIVSFPVPPEAKYCEYMVVVSARSQRHLQAICEEMHWVHKRKKSGNDPHLIIEGMNKSKWCAMDMGNVVLHVFHGRGLREFYDIESLWTLGPENDPKCQSGLEDQYALSAEDLFWMQVATSGSEANGTNTNDSETGAETLPSGASVFQDKETGHEGSATKSSEHLKLSSVQQQPVSDKDAGWGDAR